MLRTRGKTRLFRDGAYFAIDAAQEILDSAADSGYFAGCVGEAELNQMAAAVLGDEFFDVEARFDEDGRIRARGGDEYASKGRSGSVCRSWLPEEAT